jgi:hypothetical protein
MTEADTIPNHESVLAHAGVSALSVIAKMLAKKSIVCGFARSVMSPCKNSLNCGCGAFAGAASNRVEDCFLSRFQAIHSRYTHAES